MPDPSPSSDPPADPDAVGVAPGGVGVAPGGVGDTATAAEVAPPAPAPGIRCPTCGREGSTGDRFCEADGTPLVAGGEPPATPMVCSCGVGAGHDGGDGFCETCGMRLVPADEQHTGEALAPAPDLGAATHVGKSHETDEDAVAIDRRERDGSPLHAIVVCDGVSSSSHGEQASAHAARAALAVIVDAAQGPQPLDAGEVLRHAVTAAHRAACEAPIPPVEGKDPPGTTLVAAIAHAGGVDVGWVGDSRAYLIPPADSGQPATALTRDHSWVNVVVESGQMTEEEAERSPLAHALVRCVGPLETPDADQPPETSVSHFEALPGSRLIVCSDGLWNYYPDASEIAELVTAVDPAADARTVAWELVHRAIAAGGHDDITVGVAFL